MDLDQSGNLVGFCALRKGGQEAAEIHPGSLAEEDGSRGIVRVDEGMEEWIEVVGRGGEVGPYYGRGKLLLDVGVELRHAWDRGGVGDESGAEDADWGGGHCDFDGVVDVCGRRRKG